MRKLYPDAEAALEGLLFDGMTICAGGFGLCGIPERLIDAIRDAGTGTSPSPRTMPASTARGWASCYGRAKWRR